MPAMFDTSRLFLNILCVTLILCLTHLLVRNAPILSLEVQTTVLAMHLNHVLFV
ncbi:hypothetical protein L227DRAFT_132228 [Lentinus tigrinus ALCF2SS1-6]|uniref:Uncharacterized protein n=1 Tax=Lentinus tigrinus ALCF2SS1-6 TaxID=1328759 RepID=A0A5C2SR02_9APHY|nr:hypothetical protein L227DRAFT_132228 [Lentinus tigrinus ALCF2SS1-6]